jgi:hypothetical protein
VRNRHAGLLDVDHVRRLFDSGIVGLVAWDDSGAIHDANDKFLEIFGFERDELETGSLHWQALTSEESHPPGTADPTDREYRRKDGTQVFVRLRSANLDADPHEMLSVVVDISAQKLAEAERDALLECERRARAEAEAAVRARDEILAIVSHDLRNPLDSISMSASVIENTGSHRHPQVGIIRRAVTRMSRLIQDLLDVNQVASGRLVVTPAPVDLAVLMEEMRSTLQPQMLARHQQFTFEPPGAAAVVLADAHRICQVLANLVTNASKFTPEGGRITLRAFRVDDEMHVSVTDTGQGIDAHDLPHVFDRFWQARRVRRGGVGLGLPIAKGIIDAHGGRIWAESSPGVGTTFTFTLRLAHQRS